MQPHEDGPRHANATRAKVSGRDDHHKPTASLRPALVSAITIDIIAEVLGRSYLEGPFACLACRRHTSLLTCVVVTDQLAHCGTCGRDWTLARLRRAVTEDPQDARTLRRMLQVAV